MRNPLSSIKMNVQALQKKVEGDPAYSELADIAAGQVARLETMLTDLLGFGKPIQLQLAEISFSGVVNDVLDVIRPVLGRKHIILEIEDDPGDLRFRADAEQIRRVLTNLIDNAAQATPEGGEIKIVSKINPETSDNLLICIRDSGPGIPDDKIEKLFQPFFTTKESGTGLGLANVKKIVEYHNGSVTAENLPDGGAEFIIELPIGGPPV
jgi:two-component system sensor histidine kinase AtoS